LSKLSNWLHEPKKLWAIILLDIKTLNLDIKAAVSAEQMHRNHQDAINLHGDNHWTTNVNGHLYFKEQIFVPDIGNLHLCILKTKHNHVLTGHPGQAKTLQLVQQDYTWPNLQTFVMDYMNSCSTCSRNKARYHKLYGSLKQLLILPQPWESISMDFIKCLPELQRYTDILVAIDRLTKQAVFVLTLSSINVLGLAELFAQNVFSKHGVLSHVTSDRGTEFVSEFFISLVQVLSMKLHFLAGYHPEADRQTECTNQILEQYLRIYCNYQ